MLYILLLLRSNDTPQLLVKTLRNHMLYIHSCVIPSTPYWKETR
jgi:hypothetical protein